MEKDNPVLIERYPELAKLDADEQMLLAGELFQRAARSDAVPELPEDILQRIEASLDEYLADPSSGISWEAVKQRLKRESAR
jgi:putative addiction module component (TIGR02574 family)